ncbi:hypothetical protein Syun_005570 [Stephania yunnanensis]|uniref:Uncharacterized protein n=1 Tax=Stephania yunnanensis TaxID=152371 RepID=A0AAP0L509_9MAGN
MATKYHRYMHVRSTSLPSTPHPLTAAVEEQLDKLRGWLEYSMSCSSSLSQVHQSEETLQSGFCGLTGMYECVEDLLQSQHTQQVLVHYRHEKLVDKLLDGSLRLVDVTSTTRDALLSMKECVEETQSTLRRTSCLRNETNYSYMLCRKKLHKEMQKFIGHLRDQEKHYAKPTDLVDKDADFVAIVRVLRNVEAITISVFETLLSLAPAPIKSLGGKPGSRWSLIPKLIQKKEELHVSVILHQHVP